MKMPHARLATGSSPWRERLLHGMWWCPKYQEQPSDEWRKSPCAVLLSSHKDRGPLRALDLYPTEPMVWGPGRVNDRSVQGWRALSGPGVYTYAHSDGLRRGETWHYVTEQGVFVVKGYDMVTFNEVCSIYGAREIARSDGVTFATVSLRRKK